MFCARQCRRKDRHYVIFIKTFLRRSLHFLIKTFILQNCNYILGFWNGCCWYIRIVDLCGIDWRFPFISVHDNVLNAFGTIFNGRVVSTYLFSFSPFVFQKYTSTIMNEFDLNSKCMKS